MLIVHVKAERYNLDTDKWESQETLYRWAGTNRKAALAYASHRVEKDFPGYANYFAEIEK